MVKLLAMWLLVWKLQKEPSNWRQVTQFKITAQEYIYWALDILYFLLAFLLIYTYLFFVETEYGFLTHYYCHYHDSSWTEDQCLPCTATHCPFWLFFSFCDVYTVYSSIKPAVWFSQVRKIFRAVLNCFAEVGDTCRLGNIIILIYRCCRFWWYTVNVTWIMTKWFTFSESCFKMPKVLIKTNLNINWLLLVWSTLYVYM